jgi:hypothetical protein
LSRESACSACFCSGNEKVKAYEESFVTPVSPRKTRRTVVSTLARKSPVKRKAVSPVKDVPIARKLRPRK